MDETKVLELEEAVDEFETASLNEDRNKASNNSSKPEEAKKGRDKKQKKSPVNIVLLVLLLTVGAGCYLLFNSIFESLTADALESYQAAKKVAYDTANSETYKEQYELAYKDSEAENHVSNRGTIALDSIKEISRLEVLRVSDVEYVINDGNTNSDNITTWLEVPGEGTFTVNLEGAEFIVDSENLYVMVRVPKPELTNLRVDYKNVQVLLFKNDFFNESYLVGENEAKQMVAEGEMLIRKELLSNQEYYKYAAASAERSIEYLIRQVNTDEPDLEIEVEFY